MSVEQIDDENSIPTYEKIYYERDNSIKKPVISKPPPPEELLFVSDYDENDNLRKAR